MNQTDQTRSLWIETTGRTDYGIAAGDLDVDVAIVGAGITGLTAAWLLRQEGKSVAIIDAHRILEGETGHTTAHVTEVLDLRYKEMISKFGLEDARHIAAAARDALESIARLVGETGADCGFRRLPAFIYTESKLDVDQLQKEAEAAQSLGVPAEFTTEVPLPFPTQGAVRFEGQGQFHPRQYLLRMAEKLVENGCVIHESTRALNVHDGDPCRVETDRGMITARDVIVAANVPVNNRVLLITKIAAYRTYAVASATSRPLDGLFWDTADPYHYTRSQTIDGKEYIILGGEDHKTGTKRDTDESFRKLEAFSSSRFGVESFDYRWSGQIIVPVDGLPYIGLNSMSKHVYVSTGYAGEGMTMGTLGGILNAELILGKERTYSKLFDATRIDPLNSAVDYVTENIDFPKHIVRDRIANADSEGDSPQVVAPGEGKIITVEGKKLAVYRNDHGVVCALSPICPHLQCDVAWNTAEKSWDCPCHGSRFTAEGKMLNGPAIADLEKVEIPA